jgi:hypothetical protein
MWSADNPHGTVGSSFNVDIQRTFGVVLTGHSFRNSVQLLQIIVFALPDEQTDISNAGGLFIISCGGVRLSPLGTSATNWPTVPAPHDRRV